MGRCSERELGRKIEISRTELESIARKKKTKTGDRRSQGDRGQWQPGCKNTFLRRSSNAWRLDPGRKLKKGEKEVVGGLVGFEVGFLEQQYFFTRSS